MIFWTFVMALIIGYVIGHYIKPNLRLRKAIEDIKAKCKDALEDGRKGIYKTLVTENSKSSELLVEVKELAVTQRGQVKVEYLSAFYKNPEFRSRKGDALLKEVQGLLGNYLPLDEIEWYETTERHEKIKKYIDSLEKLHT